MPWPTDAAVHVSAWPDESRFRYGLPWYSYVFLTIGLAPLLFNAGWSIWALRFELAELLPSALLLLPLTDLMWTWRGWVLVDSAGIKWRGWFGRPRVRLWDEIIAVAYVEPARRLTGDDYDLWVFALDPSRNAAIYCGPMRQQSRAFEMFAGLGTLQATVVHENRRFRVRPEWVDIVPDGLWE